MYNKLSPADFTFEDAKGVNPVTAINRFIALNNTIDNIVYGICPPGIINMIWELCDQRNLSFLLAINQKGPVSLFLYAKQYHHQTVQSDLLFGPLRPLG